MPLEIADFVKNPFDQLVDSLVNRWCNVRQRIRITHLNRPDNDLPGKFAQLIGNPQRLCEAKIVSPTAAIWQTGQIRPGPSPQTARFAAAATRITDNQPDVTIDPIEQACRRIRDLYGNVLMNNRLCQLAGDEPTRLIIAVRAANTNDQSLCTFQGRSILTLRKWVEQLIQGS